MALLNIPAPTGTDATVVAPANLGLTVLRPNLAIDLIKLPTRFNI